MGLIREQRGHVHVLAGGPLRPGDVAQAGGCQVEAGVNRGVKMYQFGASKVYHWHQRNAR